MNLIIKLWAFITRQELVWLKDYDNEITLATYSETPFGRVAKRHWPFNIRNVLLGENGLVENGAYVKEWRPYKEPSKKST